MLGFIIGTVCLVGLIKVLRWNRRGYGYGACGGRGFHGHGGHGHHHHQHGGWGRGGWRRGGGSGLWLRGLFERLDTSPGQEKVIKKSVEDLFQSTRNLRGELDESRRDAARAMRGASVDEVALGEAFARQDEKLREIRKSIVGALANVHEALDEDQRNRLADMLERGLGGEERWGRFGGAAGHGDGPYRGGPWS